MNVPSSHLGMLLNSVCWYSVKPDNFLVELHVFDFLQLFVRASLVYDFAVCWLIRQMKYCPLTPRGEHMAIEAHRNSCSLLNKVGLANTQRLRDLVPWVFSHSLQPSWSQFSFPSSLQWQKEHWRWGMPVAPNLGVWITKKKWPCGVRHGLFDVQLTSTQFLLCAGYFLCTYLILQHPSQ